MMMLWYPYQETGALGFSVLCSSSSSGNDGVVRPRQTTETCVCISDDIIRTVTFNTSIQMRALSLCRSLALPVLHLCIFIPDTQSRPVRLEAACRLSSMPWAIGWVGEKKHSCIALYIYTLQRIFAVLSSPVGAKLSWSYDYANDVERCAAASAAAAGGAVVALMYVYVHACIRRKSNNYSDIKYGYYLCENWSEFTQHKSFNFQRKLRKRKHSFVF